MTPLLEIKGLRTHFSTDDGIVRAVDGVDITINKGETLCVVGESGCGKTVTAMSILQLIAMPPGRIVEGQIIEVTDHAHTPSDGSGSTAKPPAKRGEVTPNGTRKLLYYSYSISGVTYETAQDVTGLEERAHLTRVAAGQTASVKYDPANPSNSILMADDWSGL